MIVYALRCSEGHEFEAWFRSGDAFEAQADAGEVVCPFYGGNRVGRALMAPNIARGHAAGPAAAAAPASAPDGGAVGGSGPGHRSAPGPGPGAGNDAGAPMMHRTRAPLPAERALIEAIHRLRAHVERHCRDVGDDFAAEARRMHRGEIDPDGIYGRVSRAEAEALEDEGVAVLPLPWPVRTDS